MKDINWRPIADAPKDGEHVLVCGGSNYEFTSVVYWSVDWWWFSDAVIEVNYKPTHFAYINPPEETTT